MAMVKIGDRLIGKGEPPFIVAEAGINHNGELDKALEMISVAKKAGVDAIKFQTYKAEEVCADPEQLYTYTSQGKTITESMLEMFRRYELSMEEWRAIKKKCDEEEIMFFSTPQNRTDLELLLEFGIPAIKVGSDDFTNTPLLKNYTLTGLPIIISCGMADLVDVHEALNAIGALDGYPTILLLCTSQYPTPPEDVNLLKLETLSKAFPMIPLGFSDHTQGPLASSLAVAFGACFLEKHFTLSHDLPGPDHWFSEDPDGLSIWAASIRKANAMTGSSVVKPTRVESENKKEFQRVIVALRKIQRGDVFDDNNIGMRRIPGGNGLAPSLYETLLGRKSNRDYGNGAPINL